MAKEVISRCDVCGTSEGAQEFRITHGGEARDVDLCPEHAAPVLKVYELGTRPGRAPSKPRSNRSAHAVIPIEEWQQGQ